MHLDMHQAKRCGARTRRGTPCESPARQTVDAEGRPSPGAPKGNRNALKLGRFTTEAVTRRREITALVRPLALFLITTRIALEYWEVAFHSKKSRGRSRFPAAFAKSGFPSAAGLVVVSSKYRPDIDGLRAIAVIAVVLFHTFPNQIPGGFIGVDVFFVISGYLITQIILTDVTAGKFSVADFYARRVRRIFPALIIVLVASLFLGWRFLLPSEMISLGRNAAASALFSANFMLLSEVGYFDLAARVKPLLHLWSLGIEEQFYLVWPLLLCSVPRRRIPTFIIFLALGSFALNISMVSAYPSATFYLPFTRAWELLAGAILLQISKPRGIANEVLSLAGLLILSVTIFLFDKSTEFPGWAAVLPVIATGAILLADGSLLNRALLSNPLSVGIGLISYPLYLWHWPLLVFFDLHKFVRPPTDIERALIVLASLFLAWLTFRIIERPIRSKSKFVAKPLLGIMSAVMLVSLLPASGYIAPLPQPIAQLITPPDRGGWRPECVLSESGTLDIPQSCIDRKRPLIAIWGDSTAAALIPGFQKLKETFEFGIAQYTVSSCPPLMMRVDSITSLCVQKNQQIAVLMGAASPDIVVLQAYWNSSSTIEAIKPTIDALRERGIRNIYILGSVPIWHRGLPGLVAAFYRQTGSVIPTRIQQQDADPSVGKSSMRQAANVLGVKYISARDALCNADGCLVRVGTTLTASDSLHLSRIGSEILVQAIAPELGFAPRLPSPNP